MPVLAGRSEDISGWAGAVGLGLVEAPERALAPVTVVCVLPVEEVWRAGLSAQPATVRPAMSANKASRAEEVNMRALLRSGGCFGGVSIPVAALSATKLCSW
ncbi:hypothetical protein DYGSA30_23770 [Dyella sp. GSA-30]|nr:hypothetical protein DYGSA30_23770 [Dyella sp. GSA-30]